MDHQRDLLKQYITFASVRNITDLTVWAYYSILLYKETGSIQILILDRIMYFVGIWIGFVIGSFVIDRIGYLTTARFSAIFQGVVMFLMIIFVGHLASYFVILGLLRGMSRGTHWPFEHSFMVKEIHGARRGMIINELFGLTTILGIILPVMAGGFIQFVQNYQYIFLLGALVYIISAFLPFKYNKRPKSKIRVEEITRILRKKEFPAFALFRSLDDGLGQLFGSLFLIIPFLFIGTEIGVGALGSAIGVLAALAAIINRKGEMKIRIREGYLAYFVYTVATILLALFWTLPILIIRGLLLPLISSMGDTVYSDLDYRLREKLLGDFKNESVVELNLIIETLYLLGRIAILIIFYIILQALGGNILNIIRVAIGMLSVYSLITMYIMVQMNKNWKKG